MSPRIIFLVIGTFASGTNSLVVAGILPLIAEGLDTTVGVAGLSVTVFALAYAISAPILPGLLARLDRRVVMAGSMAVFVAGTLASIAAQGAVSFLATRAIVGIGAAAFTPQASAAAVALADAAHRGRAITLVMLGVSGATAIGVPLGTLIGDAYGYRAAFLLVAALGIVALVSLLFVPRMPPAGASGVRDQLRPLTRPAVLGLALTTVLITTGFFAVSIYFAPLSRATAGLDASGVAIVLAAFGACGVVSLLVGGRFLDRFGGTSVNVVALAVLVVGTVLIGLAPNLAAVVAVVVPWALFGNITIPAQQYELGLLDPTDPAPVFALNGSAIFVGTALGGAIGSLESALRPIGELPLLAAVPIVAALIITVSRLVRQRREAGSEGAVAAVRLDAGQP